MSGGPIVLTATLTGASDAIAWAVSGPGTLSATTGTSVTFTPNAIGPTGLAMVTATAGSLFAAAPIQVGVPVGSSIVAYAWTNQPTSASYTPSLGSSYNSTGGAITATRTAAGTYSISFAGLALTATGDVQVTATNSDKRCGVNGWGGTTVSVRCYAPATGLLADSGYNIAVIAKQTPTQAAVVGLAWAHDKTAVTYVPSLLYGYNAAGGAINAHRSAVGSYWITFTGLSLTSANVQVNATETGATCNVNSWGSAIVYVNCFDHAGAAVDSTYAVSLIQTTTFATTTVSAYLWASDPTATSPSTPSTAYSFNAAGSPLTVTRLSTGTYLVAIGDLSLSRSVPKVTAYGSEAQCNPIGWGQALSVSCVDASGAPEDSYFTVAVMANAVPIVSSVVAYAWAQLPGTASYAADPDYSYNAAGGAITATRTATGVYAMSFAGLTLDEGTVQVTAYNSSAHCTVGGWGGSTVNVNCFGPTGAAADAQYTVSVLTNSTLSTARTIAYLWSNQPTISSYTPLARYAYNQSGGAVTVTRSATGTYSATFAGLNLAGGDVQVSAYAGAANCTVSSWLGSSVGVQCFDTAGALVDSRFALSVVMANAWSGVWTQAYAWAANPTSPNYNPGAPYSYNASGGVMIADRFGPGAYRMTFSGLAIDVGNVKVTAYASSALCNVSSWADSSIDVQCYGATSHAPADSAYTVSFVR